MLTIMVLNKMVKRDLLRKGRYSKGLKQEEKQRISIFKEDFSQRYSSFQGLGQHPEMLFRAE